MAFKLTDGHGLLRAGGFAWLAGLVIEVGGLAFSIAADVSFWLTVFPWMAVALHGAGLAASLLSLRPTKTSPTPRPPNWGVPNALSLGILILFWSPVEIGSPDIFRNVNWGAILLAALLGAGAWRLRDRRWRSFGSIATGLLFLH